MELRDGILLCMVIRRLSMISNQNIDAVFLTPLNGNRDYALQLTRIDDVSVDSNGIFKEG